MARVASTLYIHTLEDEPFVPSNLHSLRCIKSLAQVLRKVPPSQAPLLCSFIKPFPHSALCHVPHGAELGDTWPCPLSTEEEKGGGHRGVPGVGVCVHRHYCGVQS